METSYIDIKLSGAIDGLELSPDTYDIRQLTKILESVEALIAGSGDERGLVTLEIQEGSVINRFKTTLPAMLAATALLVQVNETHSLRGLTSQFCSGIKTLQQEAQKLGVEVSIGTSQQANVLSITPTTTFEEADDIWVEAEVYLYGKVVNAGGKSRSTLKLQGEGEKQYTIQTTTDYLMGQEENILYRTYGVRASGLQNVRSRELKDLKLLELFPHAPKYDANYLNSLIEKARPAFEGSTYEEIMDEIRPTTIYTED